jgi:Zn-dependent protease
MSGSPAAIVQGLAAALIPMILSLTVHEFAHAFVATRLGDGTAKAAGRLTLNPIGHIDLVGTLILPALSVILGGIAFLGWAKPVPCRPDRFRKGIPPRLGLALVAVAGPASNLALAVLSVGALAVLARSGAAVLNGGQPTPVAALLVATFTLNVGLAVFNLLPFPPLDGHRLLPKVFDPIVRPLERYGFAGLMIVFLFLPSVADRVLFTPVRAVQGLLLQAFGF